VNLIGGANASNIYWQVGGVVNIGINASLNGNLLGALSITLGKSAIVNGRLQS